jgi:hypothetical protein
MPTHYPIVFERRTPACSAPRGRCRSTLGPTQQGFGAIVRTLRAYLVRIAGQAARGSTVASVAVHARPPREGEFGDRRGAGGALHGKRKAASSRARPTGRTPQAAVG